MMLFPVCIMVRTDTIIYGSDASKLFLSFEGVKMASIVPTKHHFVCTKSDDVKVCRTKFEPKYNDFILGVTFGTVFQNACVFLKSGQFEWKNNSKKLELTEDIDFVWSTNLHLKLLTLHSDITETCRCILGK